MCVMSVHCPVFKHVPFVYVGQKLIGTSWTDIQWKGWTAEAETLPNAFRPSSHSPITPWTVRKAKPCLLALRE